MKIRTATTHDIPTLAALEAAYFSEPLKEKDFEDFLQNSVFSVFIAEQDGAIASYCVLYRVCGEIQIISVATATPFRHRGIGKALLTDLIGRYPDDTFFLEVRISNLAAQKLYTSCGFTQIGIRKNFYDDPPEDGIAMARKPEK